jgi:hypothetical protein
MSNSKARVIAYYLPQFHPIPENDQWWGKGFTEWTNVARARPLFRGHYQPRVPADLGFYDLRLPEVREAQAEMARAAGIEGFCYWHYWFGNGKRLLERPFNEVLHSGKPDFGFCLAWANHSWSNKTWENSGAKPRILMEQCYGGVEDNRAHFNAVLPAFHDKRYIRVDGKPLFVVYAPLDIPRVGEFLEQWRTLALENGLPGIHFVGCGEASSSIQLTASGEKKLVLPKTTNAGEVYKMVLNLGFDALSSSGRNRAEMIVRGKYMRLIQIALRNKLGIGTCRVYQYRDIMRHFYVPEDAWENVYPALLPQWDRSPRVGKANDLYVNSTPEYFKQSVLEALQLLKGKKPEHQILMLRSWNEWAEGNYMEPDLKFGMGYINALKECLHL